MQQAINSVMEKVFAKVAKKTSKLSDDEKTSEALSQLMSDVYDSFSDELLEKIKENFPSKESSSTKPPKGKNAPKGKKNSYMFFCDKVREGIKTQVSKDKTLTPKQVNEKIREELKKKWENLSESKKDEFVKLAENDKQRYDKEMEVYKQSEEYSELESKKSEWAASHPEKRRGKEKMPVDENAPKRPLSSYLMFCQDRREELKKTGKKFAVEDFGAEWKSLSDKKKKVYTERALEAKKKYDELMKDYSPSEEFTEKLESWKKSHPDHGKRQSTKKDENAPKKTPNASQLFYTARKESMKDVKGKSNKEVQSEIRAEWKELSEGFKANTLTKKQLKEYQSFVDQALELKNKSQPTKEEDVAASESEGDSGDEEDEAEE